MTFNKFVLLFITGTIFTTSSAKTQYPIGGIFHQDNFDAEVAFRNSIVRENMYMNNDIEFIPIVKHIDRDDSVKAQKVACELISEGAVAIFGPSSPETIKIVGSIANTLGIPHILANWIPEDEKDITEHHQYTRNFFPDNNFYAKALSQIIADNEWKGFTLLYENNDSLERLVEILQMHNPDDNPVTIRQLPADTDDYLTLLKQIKISTEHRIIIDCTPQKVMEILKQGITVGMMEDYQSYIITSLDAHMLDFAELKLIRSNITTLRIMDPQSVEVQTAVHDWQQDARRKGDYTGFYAYRIKTETALLNDAVHVFLTAFRESYGIRRIGPMRLQCSDYQLGGHARAVRSVHEHDELDDTEAESTNSNKWESGMRILQMIDQKTEEGMTGRIVFDDDGKRKDFYVEILELHEEGFQKIATLDPTSLHINYTRSEAEVQSQVIQYLHNRTMIVAAIIGKPYLDYKIPKEGEILEGNDRFEGYSMDLIKEISKIVGFNYKFEIVPDNAYGSFNKVTKKWTGLVKYLLDRKADMAICDLTITYERRTAVDFTMPFMTLGISILYSKPKKEPPGLFSFMSPLSIDVWLYMASAYLAISFLLFYLAIVAIDEYQTPAPVAVTETSSARGESTGNSEDEEEEQLETIWNLSNWFWVTVGSIMQQGCDILPKAMSTRLTTSLWWFFALIVISSYTANLAAFLTMERMEESIDGAEDLAKQSTIKYGAVTGGSTMAFFKESNHSTYQRMWAAMESSSPSVFVSNNAEGIERVDKGNRNYAFLMESTNIEYNVERNCNLTQVGGLLDSKGYGIALPMNSPYRTHINQAILKLQEDGSLSELKDRWWVVVNQCDIEKAAEGDDTPELEMANVGGCFLVLLAGLGAAFLVGVYEFFWNICKIAIERKATRWEIFKEEMIFAIDLRKTKKPSRGNTSQRGSIANMSSKSLETGNGLRPGYQIGLERLNDELMELRKN